MRPSENARVKAMSENISERVKKIVVEHLGVEPDKVTESASFIDDLGADSLDTVELVMAFEEEFGCEIPDDAAETILTVGDAVKFLEKNAKSCPRFRDIPAVRIAQPALRRGLRNRHEACCRHGSRDGDAACVRRRDRRSK